MEIIPGLPSEIVEEIALRSSYEDILRQCVVRKNGLCIQEKFWDKKVEIELKGYKDPQGLMIDSIKKK